MIRWVPFLLVVLLAGCRRAPETPAVPTGPEPVSAKPVASKPGITKSFIDTSTPWQADAKFADQLGPADEVDGFLIRAPKGWTKNGTKVAPIQMIEWKSPPRPDGNFSYLMMSVVTLAAPYDPKMTPEAALQQQIDIRRKLSDRLTHSPVESGVINEIPFKRLRFSGPLTYIKGHFLKGATYAMRDGNRIVQLLATEDVANEKDHFLGAAEAAVFSFRRK